MNPQTLVSVVAINLTIILAAGTFALLAVVRCSRSPAVRVLPTTLAVLVLVLSPGVFDTILVHLNRTAGVMYQTVDPAWTLMVAPAVIAAVVAAALDRWLTGRARTAARATRTDG